MKDVGFTEKGNRIVEMSREEYNAFSRLCTAVENKEIMSNLMHHPDDVFFRDGYDFSNTFEVIRAFYETRFRVTELQRQIDAIKESLSK